MCCVVLKALLIPSAHVGWGRSQEQDDLSVSSDTRAAVTLYDTVTELQLRLFFGDSENAFCIERF